MKPKQNAKWQKTRIKGRNRFVLINGGIYFGILFYGIVLQIIRFPVEYIFADYSYSFYDKGYQLMMFFNLFISFPFGCLVGWIGWISKERKFTRDDFTRDDLDIK